MGNKQRQGVKTNLINNNIPYSSCKHFVSCTSMHRVASTIKRRVFKPFSAKKKRFIWALVYNKGLTQLHLVYFVKKIQSQSLINAFTKENIILLW